MKAADIDWSVLRGAIIFAVVSLVIGGSLVAGGYYFSKDVEAAHQRQSRRLATARGRYLTLGDEQRLVETYYPRYQDLERRGIIGPERRLDWVETLRDTAAQIKLPELRYEITSQHGFTPDFPIASGRFRIFESDMQLTIGLLHEGDLPVLFDELNRRAPGLFSVSRCTVRRAGPTFQRDPTQANLKAECGLRWYTLEPPEAGGAGA